MAGVIWQWLAWYGNGWRDMAMAGVIWQWLAWYGNGWRDMAMDLVPFIRRLTKGFRHPKYLHNIYLQLDFRTIYNNTGYPNPLKYWNRLKSSQKCAQNDKTFWNVATDLKVSSVGCLGTIGYFYPRSWMVADHGESLLVAQRQSRQSHIDWRIFPSITGS